MQKLIRGVQKFQQEVYGSQRDLFESLSNGQKPHTLFITCSDSRINPNLLTQTSPGELFIVRNAGNLVPPYAHASGGEAAAIEFAVAGLGVENIVVCGHSNCGAMKAVLDPKIVESLPAMRAWLEHADVTRRVVEENYPERTGEERLNLAIQENVLAQLDSLRTHPTIAARLARGQLLLHGWVYKIGTGQVFAYDSRIEQFKSLTPDTPALKAPTSEFGAGRSHRSVTSRR